jgi:hypothetical protein
MTWASSTGTKVDTAHTPFTFRAVHVHLVPARSDVQLRQFVSYIREAIVRAGKYGFTHVIIHCFGTYASMEWERDSSLWVSQDEFRKDAKLKTFSWPADTVAALIDLCRKKGLQPIPKVQSFGHMDIMHRNVPGGNLVLYKNPGLKSLFSGGGTILNLNNPDIYPWLFSLYAEAIELFGNPDYFDTGMDEAWEYGKGKGETPALFAGHVNKVHGYFKERSIEMIMWGDMLLEKRNPRFAMQKDLNGSQKGRTHEAVSVIDKGIIIADWHYYIHTDRFPSTSYFVDQGFRVFVTPAHRPVNIANFIHYGLKTGATGLIQASWHWLPEALEKFHSIAIAGILAQSPAMSLEHLAKRYPSLAPVQYLRGKPGMGREIRLTTGQSFICEFGDSSVFENAATDSHAIIYRSVHGTILGSDCAGCRTELLYRFSIDSTETVSVEAHELAFNHQTRIAYRTAGQKRWTQLEQWRKGAKGYSRTVVADVPLKSEDYFEVRISVGASMNLAHSGGIDRLIVRAR